MKHNRIINWLDWIGLDWIVVAEILVLASPLPHNLFMSLSTIQLVFLIFLRFGCIDLYRLFRKHLDGVSEVQGKLIGGLLCMVSSLLPKQQIVNSFSSSPPPPPPPCRSYASYCQHNTPHHQYDIFVCFVFNSADRERAQR